MRGVKSFFIDPESKEWKKKLKEWDEILDARFGSERHKLYHEGYRKSIEKKRERSRRKK